MFSQLKEKIYVAADKLRTLGNDDADNALQELVGKGTADGLITPDWTINIAICDLVNQNVNPSVMYEKLMRVLKRSLARSSAQSQILTITILEACVKNGYPTIYNVLAKSELWLELMKMAADKSLARVDAEVRDKILTLAEDYAKVLPPQEYRDCYEYLLEIGADFPVRVEDGKPPILTPPAVQLSNTSSLPTSTVAKAFQHSSDSLPPAPGSQPELAQNPVLTPLDPFAGMSEEDRLAVQAAMAEIDQEENRGGTEYAMSRQHQMPVLNQQLLPGAGNSMPAPANADTGLPDEPGEALQAAANLTALLNEMLALGTDPRELFISELAEQCVRMRSKLEDWISSLSNEIQMASALVHHEALQAAISKYDEVLAKAVQGVHATELAAEAQTQTSVQTSLILQVSSQLPAEALAAGSNFTLLGEDEDDEGEDTLSSQRVAPGITQVPESGSALHESQMTYQGSVGHIEDNEVVNPGMSAEFREGKTGEPS
ncbi:hypothetical protein CEUSTIGMA_g138.t1 [Chlamydomonas eustigma]|uniref:VHS domain-containing protein n=1 Tax=Chlamydomonas eustigma TaxID=1157962 RepID=A0A250WPU9_9CHLO|nr:hypothetical protein CEUSTIGMA_g138.t1 [Chlamydomonas eustigma]|eukprot:GAX72682.1 hypothetical protein CEUSTIGMA_g138.t1 [Chlamydomonas eustigma]